MQNNLISSAAQMETGSTPNDMLPAMNQVGCILFVPLIHYVIYPLLHRRHIYLKPIIRITIGFSFVALSMAYAAIVQHMIYSTGPCYEHPRECSLATNREPNRVNVWIQAPIFFLIAMGEAWSYATALEIASSHAPTHMKAMIQAIFPLMAGIGSVCAMGLTPFAHDPNLVIFYASLAGAMVVTTMIFWLIFRKYDKTRDEDGADEAVEGGPPLLFLERQSNGISSPTSIFANSELGSVLTKHIESPPAIPSRPDLVDSTLVGSRGKKIPGLGIYGAGLRELPTISDNASDRIARQEGTSAPPSPVEHISSPSLSPPRQQRNLQKRQSRFSMVSPELLHTEHPLQETTDVTRQLSTSFHSFCEGGETSMLSLERPRL
ncbi:peptide transporter ptr2 [Kalmusia sp. IMI 367209]|nr:peptide transporter ptr2 [Kalmusia sp. IMI 367209]